jgi:hypothetical protein
MMAGKIRLFEKVGGLLVEVPPEEAEARRAGRMVSHVFIGINVLWTAEEEAQREAEMAAEREKQKAAADALEAKAQRKAEIAGRLGLTSDELKEILS